MQFFQKIISLIMSFVMSLLGLAPALQPEDCYTQAEWYAMVVDTFDELDYDKVEGETLTEEQQIVAACKKWDVLYGEYDADAAITDVLVAESLVAAANLKVISDEDTSLKIAVDLGVISVEIESGEYEAQLISKADARTALDVAEGLYWARVLKPQTNGGVLTDKDHGDVELNSLALVENSDGLTLQTADGDVINEEDITYLAYEGSVNPFVQPEVAGINGQSILDDIEVDFSIAGLDVHAGLAEGGFDVSVAGTFKGVNVKKSYEVRNFNVDTKFEGALS
ncbi:MAG: hypothetical protein IJE63_01895, partial [Clostridia bacterium]|nr:hypothetical protein [Clostridia bacterium]